jgi:hypothetical protein
VKLPKPLTRAQAKREFLSLLTGIVADFPAHPEHPLITVPRGFTPLAPLATFARRKIEPFIRYVSRNLFSFHWSFSPGNSGTVQINVIHLRSGARVFWFLNDWHDWDEQHFVAGVAAKGVNDLEFLRLLFKRNGKDFGHEMFAAPPSEISTSLEEEPELPDLFLAAYQASPTAWESLLDDGPAHDDLDLVSPAAARELVARHLKQVVL